MSKRTRHQKNKLKLYKDTAHYPIAYCLYENKVIAVSHLKCGRKNLKVHWKHFDSDRGYGVEFREGYEFSLKKCEEGETVLCPVCHHPIDFRMWMSDTLPKIIN